jgi:hypothetical protein
MRKGGCYHSPYKGPLVPELWENFAVGGPRVVPTVDGRSSMVGWAGAVRSSGRVQSTARHAFAQARATARSRGGMAAMTHGREAHMTEKAPVHWGAASRNEGSSAIRQAINKTTARYRVAPIARSKHPSTQRTILISDEASTTKFSNPATYPASRLGAAG